MIEGYIGGLIFIFISFHQNAGLIYFSHYSDLSHLPVGFLFGALCVYVLRGRGRHEKLLHLRVLVRD